MNDGRRRIGERLLDRVHLLGNHPACEAYIEEVLALMKKRKIAVFLDDITALSKWFQGCFAHVASEFYDPALDTDLASKQRSEMKASTPNGNHHRCTDLVYSFVATAEKMVQRGTPVVLTSTRIRAFRTLTDDNLYSRKHLTFQLFWKTLVLSLDEVMIFLNYHFGVPKTDKEIRSLLRCFANSRPGFFFGLINDVHHKFKPFLNLTSISLTNWPVISQKIFVNLRNHWLLLLWRPLKTGKRM